MFEEIVKKYRDELIRFCLSQMNRDITAAEDVVQEVFFALYRKRSIDLTDNIRAWLYEAARRKIKEYNRKNPVFEEYPADEIEAPVQEQESETVLDILSDDERSLIECYYSGEDREKIAHRNGTTVNALYCKVMRIRKKLLKAL